MKSAEHDLVIHEIALPYPGSSDSYSSKCRDQQRFRTKRRALSRRVSRWASAGTTKNARPVPGRKTIPGVAPACAGPPEGDSTSPPLAPPRVEGVHGYA